MKTECHCSSLEQKLLNKIISIKKGTNTERVINYKRIRIWINDKMSFKYLGSTVLQ